MQKRLKAMAAWVVWILVSAHGLGQGADLPPREPFLSETREALSRSQQLWHRYAYRERRTELHLNPFGRMGTGGTRVLEVRPSPNPQLTYSRVIERDDVPVPRHELDRQDAEYRARVARAARDAADSSGAAQRAQDEQAATRRARMVVDDVLKTLTFEIARREIRRGRPVIVVTFTPNPAARPTTREGHLATGFAGSVWIDEALREVTDMRAVAIADVSFGGFIARVYKGTEAVVERREVEPGVWMPTRLTLSGDIRALFRRATINHVIDWSNYRRMVEP
jgi:hypothetical protein